ncbi:hypothetical protein FQA39_LY05030 [Lamprigera yunnana]|nr:hypothetical protein FQA39_LY05030 [Lamprigera yunnana]
MAAVRKVTDLTVKELKAELKKRKMGYSGNKEILTTRLKQELNSSVFDKGDSPNISNKNSKQYKYINSIQNQIKMLTKKVSQLQCLVSKLRKWISQSGSNNVNFPIRKFIDNVNICFNTNLIHCTVPYRYDSVGRESNQHTYNVNKQIFGLLHKYKHFNNNIIAFDVNEMSNATHYARNGRELNARVDSIATSCIQLAKEQIIKYSDPKYNINDFKTGDCETMLLNQTIYYLNKSKREWISIGLYYPFEFASVVKIFGTTHYVIFKEEEWIKFHEQRENINKYIQTLDTMWKPRQIGSKTLTFEMIEEKKILRIEDMCGNEVYLGWESVSEVWSLESVLRYRLSYSSGSNFKYFYEDVIRAVAEMLGDVKINIYNIINRLSEKSDDVCCMLEVLLFMPEKPLFDVQLERRILKHGQKRVKKHLLKKKMWMLYAEQHWTKTIDLKSAVERLYEKLGALGFDADHKEIYGMERYYTVQQCEELRDKYKIGRKVCKKFLKGKTCFQCLVKRISEIGLRHFLDAIYKYINIYIYIYLDTSSSSNEEECKAVEQNGEDSKTTEEEE